LPFVLHPVPAQEARERLLQSGVAGVGGSTFHALGARVLRQFYKEAGYRRPPTIIADPSRQKGIIAEVLE
jgi:superfamily I DNA/RNA helicase